jgi:aspartate/methionine/tyrosine aminotransferase
MTLTQLGIIPVALPCLPPTFQPSPALCRTLITAETRAIILVTPNNPTGAIYPASLIKEFADLAREKRIALVIDETYREFMEGRPHELFCAEAEGEDWRGYLIQLFSFSKCARFVVLFPSLIVPVAYAARHGNNRSYAIPGHRLGALIAPLRFQTQIHKTMDCIQICPARPAQRAVAWAVEGTRSWREGVRAEIQNRAIVFVEVMKDAEGWKVETVGGYFAYVSLSFRISL